MRPVLLSLVASLALLACSSGDKATVAAEASVTPADDGSTVACTSMGGTCEPYTTTCPLPQQNPTLCGDTVLLCCLPVAPVVPQGPGGGTEAGPAPGDAGGPGPADAPYDAPGG